MVLVGGHPTLDRLPEGGAGKAAKPVEPKEAAMTMRSSHEIDETGFDLTMIDPARLAYIKPMGADEARALGVVPKGIKLPKGVTLYAIHAADGTRLAVMDNWAAAYGAAVQNELVPVSLH
jgi:hypothetical protein